MGGESGPAAWTAGTPLFTGRPPDHATDDLQDRVARLEHQLSDAVASVERVLPGLQGLRTTVESAMVAQARRVETVVAAARQAMQDAAHDQSAAEDIRELLEAATEDRHRIRGLLDHVDRLSAVVEGGIGEVAEAVREQREDWDATLTLARRQIQQDTDELRAQLRSTIRALSEELRDAIGLARDQFTSTATEQADHLETVMHGSTVAATERVQAVVDGLEIRLGGIEERLDAATGALDTAQRTLAQDLAERRQQVAAERAALTSAFAEQLVEGLSRRERRRLVRHLEVPEPGTPPALVVPRSRAAPFRSAPFRSALPVQSQPVDPSAPDPSDDRDVTAARRTLAAVRGLGPAKQSALIDAFGSIEALRSASDDDLLAVRGIGPALLAPIRDAVQ